MLTPIIGTPSTRGLLLMRIELLWDSEVRQTNSCDLVWMGSFLFVFQNLAGLGVNSHFSCHTASLDVE